MDYIKVVIQIVNCLINIGYLTLSVVLDNHTTSL